MNINNLLLILFIISILLNAVADGLRYLDYIKHTTLKGIVYHTLQALAVGVFFILLLVPGDVISWFEAGMFVLGYIMLRFALFDFTINFITGKHPLYLGDTAWTDIILKKIFNTPTKLTILAGLRAVVGIGGMALIQYI